MSAPANFGHIELFVADVDAARRFYEHVLGAELVQEQMGGRIVWLRLGAIELLLRSGAPGSGSGSYQTARAGFVLYTDDLDAAIKAYTARGLVFNGDDGPGCPTFTDPDGNWFQLVEWADGGEGG